MPSTKGGTGRPKKSSSTKKPLKEPIPIDSGISQTASAANNQDHRPATQEFPGIEEEIRVRAYELYVQRGYQHGRHDEDWTQAEIEILAKYSKEKTA
jgi:hypothetical protein